MSLNYSQVVGFPTYESVEADTALVCRASFTSATDILNAANAAIGAGVTFDSALGAKSTGDLTTRIFYDGPDPGAGAWDPDHTDLATHQCFTVGFEVHRDVFDGDVGDLAGTGPVCPINFRGALNTGVIAFGRPGTSSFTTYETTTTTNHPGATSVTNYHSRYANDKEMVPIILEFRKKDIRVFIDGYHASTWVRTAWVTTEYDDLYIVGRQNAVNSTPAGFPFYFRNFFVTRRRLVLPVDYRLDRLTFIGDSWTYHADYYTNSPRVNTSHIGTCADAGFVPMVQRLAAREGFFTNDLHCSGEVGARVVSGSGIKDMITQVNGSPTSAHFDATTSNGRIAVVLGGANDSLAETTTAADFKTGMNLLLDAVDDAGFEQIVLCTIPDASEGVSEGTPAEAMARTIANNSKIIEIASERNNVHLVDLYSDLGPQDLTLFRADKIHPTENYHSQIGRLMWPGIKSAMRAI